MVDPTQITPEWRPDPKMLSWDKWLLDVHEELSVYQDNEFRLQRAREIRDELVQQFSSVYIDRKALFLGKTLIDSIIRGWFNQPVGVLCSGIIDCDIQCDYSEKCAVYEIWSRLYPGPGLKDSRVRMCSYLMIFVPEFSERTAKRLGIYQEEAF